jgi:uncharacterized small protein (DUF1192 family)
MREVKMQDEFEELRPEHVPRQLTEWNLQDLEEYISNLEAEIARCRQVIEQKKSVSFAADALFKK